MEIYLARQPIFDRSMNIFGYELLYRNSEKNCFANIDDDIATAELIYNAFMIFGIKNLTDGAKAFINFSKDLINSDLPFLLPKSDVVLEILERGEATQETVDACVRLRAMGYRIALDDLVIHDSYKPLMNIVDLIKVDYPSVTLEDQRKIIDYYKKRPRVRLLAEKIETRQEYLQAVELGYDYFQGYFFSKPAMLHSKEISSLNSPLYRILEELNHPEPRYPVIAELISSDLGLSYKLLTLANSVYIGSRNQIHSIPQALAFIGTQELYQWVAIMMVKNMQNAENAEIIKLSLIRGKMMESIAMELNCKGDSSEYFLTGMFSFIDTLMDKPMSEVLNGLPFTQRVKMALLGEHNEIGQIKQAVIDFESANWERTNNSKIIHRIGTSKLMNFYIAALKWARMFNY